MKMRAGFLATCAASALVIGIGFASPALAADKMVTKAPAAEPVQWWYEGFVEVGGRMYLNNPDKTKLGKFYEYRDLRPGVFGDFYIAAHRTNPIDIALWGTNVGWDDQAFGLDLAKPGTYYLTLGGTRPRTSSAKMPGRPIVAAMCCRRRPFLPSWRGAAAAGHAICHYPNAAFANANSRIFDLKYRRDTASAQFRWTPTDNWDVNVDYSHMHREGTSG